MKPLRIGGVPVHPVLVHFPVAGWTATTALAVATAFLEPALAPAAFYCNLFSLALGALAMTAGFLELPLLPEQPEVRDAAAHHMVLASSAWLLYLVLLLLQLKAFYMPAALLGMAAFILLVFAGHAGARLVYRHGLGQDRDRDA